MGNRRLTRDEARYRRYHNLTVDDMLAVRAMLAEQEKNRERSLPKEDGGVRFWPERTGAKITAYLMECRQEARLVPEGWGPGEQLWWMDIEAIEAARVARGGK